MCSRRPCSRRSSFVAILAVYNSQLLTLNQVRFNEYLEVKGHPSALLKFKLDVTGGCGKFPLNDL